MTMRWLAILLSLLMMTPVAQAASAQARLVRASMKDGATDQKLKDIEPKLREVFGYKRYTLLGQNQDTLQTGKQLKLCPDEGFTVFVTESSVKNKIHKMELEVYSGKASLVKNTMKIAEKNSVFIKGPEVGSELIVIVLTVLE